VLRRLIVNADDYGLTPGVSRGILRAHAEGIVTSTTVMINMPAAEEWIDKALREAPGLGLGLHLNLTAGQPVSPPDDIPDLVTPRGTFHKADVLIGWLPTLNMEQVERELRAQIDRFTALAGQPPDHLDSHHHITYLSPPMATLMLGLARELSVPVRRPIPASWDETQAADIFESMMGHRPPSRAYAEEMIDVLDGLFRKANVPTPDDFIRAFYGDGATLGNLLLLLLDTGEGATELMCHPAEVDEALESTSGYAEARQRELAALTAPSAREVINTEFIQLITFADLKSPS
jgi:predicted glycoside hydrolase/deacetylase ChbG (UPF0249 family)